MPKMLHKGPLVFSGFFAVASLGMTLFGSLPTHLAVTAKILMLIYAGLLFALAFAPVKEPGRAVAAKQREPASSSELGPRAAVPNRI